MTVLWQAQDNVAADAMIEWGSSPVRYSSSMAIKMSGDHQFLCTLTNLEPQTLVYYRVTLFESELWALHRYEGTFLMPPEGSAQALTFYAYGDTRDAPVRHDDMLSLISGDILEAPETRQTFLVHTGDFVHRGLEEPYWDRDYFQDDSRPATSGFLRSVPVMGCVGNHECYTNGPVFHYDAKLFRKYWPFGFYTSPGYYYSFDYGPAHIVVLDTYLSKYDPGSPQYAWLDQDLGRSTKPWKIAVFHYPPYDAGGGEAAVDEGYANREDERQYLCPLFEKHGVRLILNGHEHYYARCEVPSSLDPSRPLTFLVLGGGGAGLVKPGPVGGIVVAAEEAYHYARLEIAGDRLDVVVTRMDEDGHEGGTLDRFTLHL